MSSHVFDCYNDTLQTPLDAFHNFMQESGSGLGGTDSEYYINGQIFQTCIVIEEIDVLVRMIRKHWSFIQNTVLNNYTLSHDELTQVREDLNKYLKLINECLKYCDCVATKTRYIYSTLEQIETLTPLVLPVAELEDTTFMKLTSSSHNRDKCPIYQYFHTFLDMQYYILILKYVSTNSDQFKKHVKDLIRDLTLLSMKGFRLHNKSSFVCNCTKNFWLIIQFLCEKAFEEDTFWQIFNESVEGQDSKHVLWLLQDVATLQAVDRNGKFNGCLSERIRPNFGLLESSLKALIREDPSNSFLSTMKAVEPLLYSLWLKSAKIEIYQILWEYMSKRLNKSSRSHVNFTMTELVELIDTILWTPKDCGEEFELFLSLLCTHLNEHPMHWSKIKGRFYSQLGPYKAKDLSNVGLFHVLLLFISLTKVNFEELSKKFMAFVDNLPADKKVMPLVWNCYTALIVRYVRENRSIEAVTEPFLKMLVQATNDHNSSHLIKTFVADFDNILKYSVNLQLHQWLLLDSWIHKYMTTCCYPDLIAILSVLLNTFERINSEQVWCEWESSFKNYVFPTLKYIANSRSAPEICGTLAAKIAILNPNLLSEAFTFFNGENILPKVSSNFLCVVLESYPNSFIMSSQQEIIALQTWIKTCLLTRDNYEQLTRNIVKLDIIPPFLKTEIATAKDPLCSLIECLGSNIKQHSQSIAMNKFCEHCFGHVERWTAQYLAQPDNEATVLRIYTIIGLAVYKMGPLLYNKYKANSPFALIVSSILLPTELMVGKPINPYILQGIKKTWHLFFEATIKINSTNDQFIERILRDLVVKYVSHFAIVDSPMLKCLDNEITAEVILDKMSDAFFKKGAKEAESNVFKSLRIINEFVQSTTSAVLMRLVVKKTLYGLCEVVMFHSQRNMALSVIKNITSSTLNSHVKTEIGEILVNVTEKHLAFNTTSYFQLMGVLAKIMPSDLKCLMPRVRQQIANVERMRGVGYDKNLRLNLERLEASLIETQSC